MRTSEPEPWSLRLGLRDEPTGLRRQTVAPGSGADGTAVKDLGLGEDTWVSVLTRDGELVPVRGSTILHPGDELLLMIDSVDPPDRHAVFDPPKDA